MHAKYLKYQEKYQKSGEEPKNLIKNAKSNKR